MSKDNKINKTRPIVIIFFLSAFLLNSPHFPVSLAGEIEPALLREASVADSVDVIIYHKNQPLHKVSEHIKNRRIPQLALLAKRIKAALRPYLPRESIRDKKDEFRLFKQAMETIPPGVKSEIKAIRKTIDDQSGRMKQEVHAALRKAVASDQQGLSYEIERLGGAVKHHITILNAVSATIPSSSLEQIAALSNVLIVEKDKPGYPETDTSVPAIFAETWWGNGIDGGIQDFALVDSGVASSHPALSSHRFFQQFSGDPTGHGTHVAGIVASTEATYTGVAFGLDAIIVGRADDESTSMTAFDWIFSVPPELPEVVNYSRGHGLASLDDSPIGRFFDAVVDGQWTLVTKSLGNDGCSGLPTSLTYPAEAYNLIAVGDMNDNNTAERDDDFIASDSSRGPTAAGRKKPDLVAPGSGTDPGCPSSDDVNDIFSTNYHWNVGGADFVSHWGTSMAAAHAAGAVLLLADGGNTNPMAQKAVLINTADAWSDNGTAGNSDDDGPVSGKHWDRSYGWGYVNLQQAYVHRNDYFTGDVSPAGSANSFKLYRGQMFAGDKATLVWHRRAGYNGAVFPSAWYRLSNLDLSLYSEAANTLLDASASAIDNVEQVAAGVSESVVIKVEAIDAVFDGTGTEPFALATPELFSEAAGPAFTISLNHPISINPGDQFTLEATVVNSGDLNAHANAIELVLPGGFVIVSGSNPQLLAAINSGAGAVASWNVQGPDSTGAYPFSVNHRSESYGLIFTGSKDSTIAVDTATGNTAPTISDIANQSTAEDTPTNAIAFTVGDVETPAADLTVSGSSGNQVLVPDANIIFGGVGANRTVIITPAENQSGAATITVTVSDGAATASDSFLLTVTAQNDPPTISDIADRSTAEDTPTGAIAFTVGDVETAATSLTVSGSSSNQVLVPDANIIFGGAGANRTVAITPAGNQNGAATITVTVSDGAAMVSDSFLLTVTAQNDPPTISDIADRSTAEDTPTGAIAFTVGDVETPAADLTVSVSSSNQVLVPDANIVFGGSGPDRTVTITPAGNQSGAATITVTVSDGVLTASDTFVLTVSSVNDPPTISDIADRSTAEDTPTGAIAFAVDDVETAATSLTVSGSSSNQVLVPDANIVFGGSGPDRTVTITPAGNQSGAATITVTVSDGTATAGDAFTISVTAVNDAPTTINLSSAAIKENEQINVAVGIFSNNDPDSGDTHTYSLVSGAGSEDNTSFTITGNTLKTAAVFDYETKNIYSIRVRVDDANGGVYEKPFVIKVTDVYVLDGDINNDGVVALSDLILSIQIGSGILPTSSIDKESDVNGDNKIGLEETIYIMQTIAGLRSSF